MSRFFSSKVDQNKQAQASTTPQSASGQKLNGMFGQASGGKTPNNMSGGINFNMGGSSGQQRNTMGYNTGGAAYQHETQGRNTVSGGMTIDQQRGRLSIDPFQASGQVSG